MWLQDVERNVLDGYLIRAGVSLAEADGMRRLPPMHREYFDDFIFTATAMAVGEADGAAFGRACLAYRSAVGDDLHRAPQLIPPDVADVVVSVVTDFEPFRAGDERVTGRGRINKAQMDLVEQLYYSLGGDLGDGLSGAGARVHSKMLSARIADGFVHPAVGAHIWSDTPAAPRRHQDSGPDITVLDSIADAAAAWVSTQTERPSLERRIVSTAQSLGWSQ